MSFEHTPGLPLNALLGELENAGFDIIQTQGSSDYEPRYREDRSSLDVESVWPRFSDFFTSKPKRKVHEEYCVACQEENPGQFDRSYRQSSQRTVLSPPHTVGPDPAEVLESTIDPNRSTQQSHLHYMQAVFAIDGMAER